MEVEIYMLKKPIILLFVCAAAAIPLYPATVSFLVIEAGLPEEYPVSQHSIMWENGMMDVFFEMGHIVSNSPMMRLDYTPSEGFPDEAEKELESAKEGGMEYLLIAVVNHPSPHHVSLRLFRTASLEMILEHKYADRNYTTRKEELDAVRENVMVLARRIR